MYSKSDIIDCQTWAAEKGGKCLEVVYRGVHPLMSWECALRHVWKNSWRHIRKGQWCPKCAGKSKPDINECRIFVQQKHNGKCLNDTYINAHYKMLWECDKGHQWQACWNSIGSQKKWCPYCSKKVKGTIEECKLFVEQKYSGNCLETVYINALSKMLWECEKGHQWKATWNDIKNNLHWCPECSSFKTEYKCKELLEQKLGFKFKKIRFCIDNKRYEWDGYNEEHKIVFEYNGEQHYVFPNYFHKTLKIYEAAKQRDIEKVQYAKENGIKLIIIPYTEEKNLESYIENLEFPNP